MGRYALCTLDLQSSADKTGHKYLFTSLIGLALIAALHVSMRFSSIPRVRQTILLFYFSIKALLIWLIGLFAFQLTCGLWIDICYLQIFDVTLQDRLTSYQESPQTLFYLYWVQGFVISYGILKSMAIFFHSYEKCEMYHSYLHLWEELDFASFFKEMINVPVISYVAGFFLMFCAFASTSFVTVWLPFRLIKIQFGEYEDISFNDAWSIDGSMYWTILVLANLVFYLQAFETERIQKLITDAIRVWAQFNIRVSGLEPILNELDRFPDKFKYKIRTVIYKAKVNIKISK